MGIGFQIIETNSLAAHMMISQGFVLSFNCQRFWILQYIAPDYTICFLTSPQNNPKKNPAKDVFLAVQSFPELSLFPSFPMISHGFDTFQRTLTYFFQGFPQGFFPSQPKRGPCWPCSPRTRGWRCWPLSSRPSTCYWWSAPARPRLWHWGRVLPLRGEIRSWEDLEVPPKFLRTAGQMMELKMDKKYGVWLGLICFFFGMECSAERRGNGEGQGATSELWCLTYSAALGSMVSRGFSGHKFGYAIAMSGPKRENSSV